MNTSIIKSLFQWDVSSTFLINSPSKKALPWNTRVLAFYRLALVNTEFLMTQSSTDLSVRE